MKKKTKTTFLVLCLIVAGTGVYFGRCLFSGGCALTSTKVNLSPNAKQALAEELVGRVKYEGQASVRTWLKEHGPQVTEQVMASLDNTNDRASRARMAVLHEIYSLGSDGFSPEVLKSWAETLRRLARTMLHPGVERSDYLAKSYLMEGREKEAAAEYRAISDYPPAEVFFKDHPEMRGPASR